jgi:hypothetical protein
MVMRFIIPLFPAILLTSPVMAAPPVEVTRFHLDQSITPGKIQIIGDSTLEGTLYKDNLIKALASRGFEDIGMTRIMPTYRVAWTTTRDVREQRKRSPFSVGIGGSTGGRVGVGIGTQIGIGGKKRQMIITQLSVTITRTSDNQRVWEGRASTAVKSTAPEAQPRALAQKLASALFKDFPGRSGETITLSKHD